MKKTILVIAMLTGFAYNAASQEAKYGFKAGVNFSTLTGDVPAGTESKTGFHIGGVAEYPASEKFSIQPEIVYSEQGATFTTEIPGFTGGKTDIKVVSLNVPILGKYYITNGFSIEAGPQISYRLTSSVNTNFAEEEYGEGGSQKMIEFGLAGGVAYDISSGLFFQARYAAGLTKINDDKVGNVKNSVFSISVGYKFL